MARTRDGGREVARMLATLLWVLGASAVTVAFLGALPGWIVGEGRSVRRVATIEEAERRLGARVVLPAVFPDRLAWPPERIRVAGGRRGSVALTFADRSGAPALEVIEATDDAPIAPPLLEGRTVHGTSRTAVGDRPARLAAVHVDGLAWQELSWIVGGRAVVLRSRGDLDELYAIARSVHREGGR